MGWLRANLRAAAIVAAVLAVGGWLVFMSAAAGAPGSSSAPGSYFQLGESDKKTPPRLDSATPETSEESTARWASVPMPPPRKDGPKPPAQGPVVVPSASSVVIGTEITIRGQDFAPQSQVTVRLESVGSNGVLIAEEYPVNRDGAFAFPFTPGAEMTPGDYSIVATSGGKESRANLKLVRPKPVALIDRAAAKPGQELAFTGAGFSPGEEVAAYLDTLAGNPILSVRADDYGNVASTLTVPMAAEGEHRLVLVGALSRVLAPTQFTVIGFYPWVDLSSYASQPEISIDFKGHSFGPNEEIWIFMDRVGGVPLAKVKTDEYGEFALARAYFVPPQLRGDHKFFFVGDSTQKMVEATFTALPYSPSIELSPYAGKPGSKLSLAGKGFARGETLRAYWGAPENGVVLSEFQAGLDGSFKGWGGLTIPLDADIMKGGADIFVVGEISEARASAWFTLVPLTPSAELSKYVGPPGETLQFSGNGFAPMEKVVIALAGSGDVLAMVQTDENGSFRNAGSFSVPLDQTDVLEFTFTGMASNAQAITHYRIGVPGEETTPVPQVP